MTSRFCWLFLLGALLCAGCQSYPHRYVTLQRDLVYGQPAGKTLDLDIYLPKHATNRLPVIIWIHGGSWKSGSRYPCPLAFLAKEGFAVVSIEYRLIADAPFPAQLHDCKGAIRWLRANADRYQLDKDHVAVFGASAGGHLAALLGTTPDMKELEGEVGGNLDQSSRVQAVCAFYPPTDLDRLITNPEQRRSPDSDIGRLMGGPLEQNLDKAALASPLRYITPDDAPFYILHGAKDDWVPLEQSQRLHAALQAAGVESKLYIVPNQGHAIGAPREAQKQIMEFLLRHLKNTAQK